jgi:hypothetical protein
VTPGELLPWLSREFRAIASVIETVDDAVVSVTTTWDAIIGKPTTFPPSAHEHTWTDITDAPAMVGVGYGRMGHDTDDVCGDLGDDAWLAVSDFGDVHSFSRITFDTDTGAFEHADAGDYAISFYALLEHDTAVPDRVIVARLWDNLAGEALPGLFSFVTVAGATATAITFTMIYTVADDDTDLFVEIGSGDDYTDCVWRFKQLSIWRVSAP